MAKINWSMRACSLTLLWAATAIALPAQTFTTLHSFNETDGNFPQAPLIQATNGKLYGSTFEGGADCPPLGCGTVFKISPSGTLTMLHSFDSTDGAAPSGVVQATNGDFYGTTSSGGPYTDGTVFNITPSGTLTTLHSFAETDGAEPIAGLVQGTDGNFYGTTLGGGNQGAGTVFKITPSGMLTTLHRFDSTDGAEPFAGLVQGTDGNFYGTTVYGGATGFGYGTVFRITPSGTLTTLHSFDFTDGAYPLAGLVQGTNGDFYGTTYMGGTNSSSCHLGCGTVFRITPGGTLTTLHSFDFTDGDGPHGLIQGTDGRFYGTTVYGGANNGTLFKITPTGVLTTLHSFDETDGAYPGAALLQDTNGKFYGTTEEGGTYGEGTVFSLSVGLGPFAATNPTSGNVGKAVHILGTNLKDATSVTFNGAAATFTVESRSLITTTVPSGATTGTVQVVTPGGTLSSNVPFQVLP